MTDAKIDKGARKRERSPAQVPLLLFSTSNDSQGPRVKNIKSIGNLNGMWLRVRAASLLDCLPPNSKSLNLSKLSSNSQSL
jgi:hypothetical protein